MSAQDNAADAGASVWVAASAGTGKTTVLTNRVLALMLGGSEPARILCLTFTKAAAAEMAIRLNDRLSAWATIDDGKLAQELVALLGDLPDADLCARARRLFARMLDAPGGMKIETIHAFCQSLLRRFPLEAQIAPHFELLDERGEAEALAEARDAMLAEARRYPDGALGRALAEVTAHAAESTFDELMDALVGARANLAAALARGEAGFRDAMCRLLDLPPDATPESIVAAASLGDFGLAEAVPCLAASTSTRDQERGATIARWLADEAGRPAQFDNYAAVFFTQQGEERADIMTKSLAAKYPAVEAALRNEAARLAAVLARRNAAALLRASLALATLGGAILAHYTRHKDDRALLDYDDLILKTRDLLRRPGVAPWVLYKLDGGIDHILIDEAQDTNPEQWEVVQGLADEFFTGLSAREVPRTIFAVGDAKQSIYSFQRADPEAFRHTMRDHFERRATAVRGGWRKVELDRSFRSTPAVLTAVDAVFARSEARAGVVEAGATLKHEPDRARAGGLVEVWPPVLPVDQPPLAPWEPPTEQRRRHAPPARLAQAIAATLARWLATGERLSARDRRVRPGDVLVLVRRRTPFVTELVRAFKERNVAVAGADRMRLTQQLAVQDMLALLQFLLLPDDDLTLATVLKGPLIGFDDDRLFALAQPRGQDARLWSELRRRAGEHPDFARAVDILGGLLARVDYTPPYELIAEILGAGGGNRQMLARLGPEAADPLDELLAAALAYERRNAPSLQGFLHWLVAGDIEVKRDLDQRGRDEVRIMTVHGAKGLQAPIVFLPDTMQVPPQLPRPLWSADGLPLHTAHQDCAAPALDSARALAQQRRDEEYRRLLYVAMTRAEDRLYVCGWETKKATPAGCWYNLVTAGLGDAGAQQFAFDCHDLLGGEGWAGTGLRLVTPQRGKAKSDDSLTPRLGFKTALPSWATAPPPPEPTPPRPLAPSQPAGAEPAARSPLGTDAGAGFRRGQLVHRLLQSLPQLPPGAREDAARRFLARPVHGLVSAAQDEILHETLAVLADPDFAPLFAPDAAAEVPVVGLVGERAISGRIDRLVVRKDAVLIVDYKTLCPVPASAAEIPPIYLAQLKAYRSAVAAIYPGRHIGCALLWTDGPKLMPVSDALLDASPPPT